MNLGEIRIAGTERLKKIALVIEESGIETDCPDF
jgi:hypothetical protein